MHIPRRLLGAVMGVLLGLSIAIGPVSAARPVQVTDGSSICELLFSLEAQFGDLPGAQSLFALFNQEFGCED